MDVRKDAPGEHEQPNSEERPPSNCCNELASHKGHDGIKTQYTYQKVAAIPVGAHLHHSFLAVPQA
jgi:hypothetical protein